MAGYNREQLKEAVKVRLAKGMTVKEIADDLGLSEAIILHVKNRLMGRYPWGVAKK